MTSIAYNEVASQAVEEYDIWNYSLRFIRHSDNVTFKVECPGLGAFLLRIHVPVTRAMGTHGDDPRAINSELLWLEALSQDTDLVLQKPVRNQRGELVTQIPVENADSPVNCSLLHWVDGEPYLRDLESEGTSQQIGEILAKLHNHASHWAYPDGFTRPKRDIVYFERMLKGIQPALQDGRISPLDYAEFETSIGLLVEMLGPLDENRQTYGIMHADTHKGNMLLHEGVIRLIDFSFCSFGNFMFDLGVCLSDMKPELHRSFMEGYRNWRVLPEHYHRLVEGLFVGSIVGTFSFWVDNPRTQEVLVTKVPQIATNFAARFNRGEFFWSI
jgi:Ser/Thr protein kinase RdoA (MazF antagonist)